MHHEYKPLLTFLVRGALEHKRGDCCACARCVLIWLAVLVTVGSFLLVAGSFRVASRPRNRLSVVASTTSDQSKVAASNVERIPEPAPCDLKQVYAFLYEGHEQNNSASNARNVSLSKCDTVPPGLVGAIKVQRCNNQLRELEQLGFNLEPGGYYRPRHCNARAKVAFIIPFRNRWQHLGDFLLNMHPLLQKQELEYRIFVINQDKHSKFNRGLLLNIGFVEASKLHDYDCYIFHDVDLLPENDQNLYRCPSAFRHYSVSIDKFDYKLPYPDIVGGALAATASAFEKVNGFSNMFFGWGGEDDDFSARIRAGGLTFDRYSADIGRYKMIKHNADFGNEANPERFKLLAEGTQRITKDGLSSLYYSVTGISYEKMFTLVNVSVSQQQIMNKFIGVAAHPKTRS